MTTWLAVKAWLVRWWKWIAGGVAAVIALVIARKVLTPKPLVVVQPGPSEKQREEETKAQVLSTKARDERDVKTEAVKEEHQKKVDTLNSNIEHTTAKVVDDPELANAYIKDVSNLMGDD